jgi:phosphate transport system substrate-binding protein
MCLQKLCLPIYLLLFWQPAWSQSSASVQLVGVGSTTPVVIYATWFREFQKTHPNLHFSYMPSGSSDGIALVSSGKADFGGTDVPMTSDQLGNAGVLQFPAVLGALVPVYNLPDAVGPLKFSPRVLAGIYLGRIKRWNDPALVELNPEAQLPASKIIIFHSSEGRGSAYVWSDFLSKTSAEWRTRVGGGAHITPPTGVPVAGNGRMAAAVKQTPNSFGYVWFGYALLYGLTYGPVQNAAGNFVTADSASVAAAAAAAGLKTMPADFRISITNPPGERSYPIASFTWLLLPGATENTEKREAMRQFLFWMLSSGQDYAVTFGFTPLPPAMVTRELEAIKKAE